MQFNSVVATNTGAIRLWQRHGYAIVGTVPGAYRHSRLGYVDSHIMFKSLVGVEDGARAEPVREGQSG
jgi:ribosomal protein S18 acetylase RimI-like enzyme